MSGEGLIPMARVSQLLAADPVCGGRVCSETVEAIGRLVGEPAPLLTYAEARAVGEQLATMPVPTDGFGWADWVQQTLRLARNQVDRRESDG